jgi:uncharacterized membrane protein
MHSPSFGVLPFFGAIVLMVYLALKKIYYFCLLNI